MEIKVFDPRTCTLGEGALWHPVRRQLFWLDINRGRLMTRDVHGPRAWEFGDATSAAGWIDRDHLLVATAGKLVKFSLASGLSEPVCPLEPDNPDNRPNDGRADPWGGFWISTMSRHGKTGAGAIHRYYLGELRRLYHAVTTPNAISFAPDRSCAYFADTRKRMIWRQPLGLRDGWPKGEPALFADLSEAGLRPDGAVTAADGTLWVALYGAARVIGLAPDGQLKADIPVPARNPTCPAFGGANLSTLFVTSATQGLDEAALAEAPDTGKVLAIGLGQPGLAEPAVAL